MIQLLEIAGKDFKAAIITIHNDIKENILTMNEKIQNFSKEINHGNNKIYS